MYMFTNTAAGWKQAAELKGSDTVADNGFGVSVAISGTHRNRVCARFLQGCRSGIRFSDETADVCTNAAGHRTERLRHCRQ